MILHNLSGIEITNDGNIFTTGEIYSHLVMNESHEIVVTFNSDGKMSAEVRQKSITQSNA